MTFEEWWKNVDMVFESEKHKKDAMAIANRAWNVAVNEMVKQEKKTRPPEPAPVRCMFCGGVYFHEKTCRYSSYRTK